MAKQLSETPTIGANTNTTGSHLGAWTELGHDVEFVESSLGDYSYAMQRTSIVWTEIGKFCSIASDVRINPGNHPTWRASQHHFTYRAAAYGLGEDDKNSSIGAKTIKSHLATIFGSATAWWCLLV